jgi:hypothetical protein
MRTKLAQTLTALAVLITIIGGPASDAIAATIQQDNDITVNIAAGINNGIGIGIEGGPTEINIINQCVADVIPGVEIVETGITINAGIGNIVAG